jgi:ribonucleoside-diphosphate reductase alpha chain
MLSCSINHPDAGKFITAKDDTTKITGANISVKVSDKFMNTFLAKYEAENVEEQLKAVNLWQKLVHQAWKNAEPGVLFWDTITRESPADCYEGFKSTSTNPCKNYYKIVA